MHQPTLMSPRYSNVTTSIRELIIRYASKQLQIHYIQSEYPKVSIGEKKMKTCNQPLCLDHPKVTGIRELITKTYIK